MSFLTLRIRQHPFRIPERYSEGHCCSAGEAQGLNQLMLENVRNNTSDWVIEALAQEEGELLSSEAMARLQDRILAYALDYQFQVREETRDRKGPLELEIEKVARERAQEYGNAKGLDVFDIELAVPEFMAQGEVHEEARRRIKLKAGVAAQALQELFG